VLVEGQPGRAAIGIKVDRRNRLFVAGGPTGMAFVYDARTGEDLASYRLTPEGTAATFVNDVVVTGKGAFFTDSLNQQLYVVPFGRGGRLPGQDKVRVLPLTGDLVYVDGFNLNGIAADRGGRALLAVQSNTGLLFRINPRTGVTRQVDLGGSSLTNGDGLLLTGRVLFVVRNQLNQIDVVKLNRSLDRGRVVATLTDPDFDVPTTIAFQAGRLYAVNARFGTTDPESARYDIVRVG
jgi:sugar lactone lactonase YvrE